MEFYEIEYLLQELEDFNKEEANRQKKEEAEARKQSASMKPPKIDTNYGGFKTPKLPTKR